MEIVPSLAFYITAIALAFFALRVITAPNPIHSALYLALTMIGLAGVFFNLHAEFIAGVQLIVYAGAVMVLFVMVMMLFDLDKELRAFSKGLVSGLLKIFSAGFLAGAIWSVLSDTTGAPGSSEHLETLAANVNVTRELALLLFSKYFFPFEVLGILLLVIAVGVVAISRVRGGSHAK